jgi:putative PIG3 family NAD(P)H quinone oxidoreductase
MRVIRVQDDAERTLALVEAPALTIRPDDVLVDVKATAVNRADLLQRRGLYPPPPGESDVIGLEAAGVVASVGAAVRDWKTGDRVVCLLAGGGYAEQVVVHQAMLLPIPRDLDFTRAAAIPEAFYTAFVNLVLEAGLAAGECVLVHAGGSGVGTAAIQLGRALGARVLITAGSADKLARCRELGAEGAIDYKQEDFAEAIDRLTGKAGVDVVLDCVGGSYLAKHTRIMRMRGRLVVIGLMGGTHAELDLATLVRKRQRVIGSVLRTRTLEEKIAITAAFKAEVLPLFERGALRPVVDSVFPLRDVEQAHARVAANENFGKVILEVSDG